MASSKDNEIMRLSHKAQLRIIRKIPSAVLLKGFALERMIERKRVFGDIDIYVGDDFMNVVSFLKKQGYKRKRGIVPLFAKHKVDVCKGGSIIEIHRRLFPIYTPFCIDSLEIKKYIIYDKKLKMHVFCPEFSFVYGVGHFMYGHMLASQRGFKKLSMDIITLYKKCNEKKIYNIAKGAHMLEWCYLFLYSALCEENIFSKFVNHKKVLDIQYHIVFSKNSWWTYIHFAPLLMKPIAFCDFLMKALFYRNDEE